MFPRHAQPPIESALRRQAAVAVLGPRQVGKTTLARALGEARGAVYFDLERPSDLARLAEPELALAPLADRLVILDEIHRAPALFQTLRGLIDEGRRDGRRHGRFLMLGSASIELMRQAGESLAGRLEYVDLPPLNVLEVLGHPDATDAVWLRGGFPDSLLAASDGDSLAWRLNFIRTYLERDVPQFGPRLPAATIGRLWTMLAHLQGEPFNASRLATSLAVTAPAVDRYVDLLVDLLLLRRLPPWSANSAKRLVKTPRLYVRDSGLVHALLGLVDATAVQGHPVVGQSWEGFVIENLLSVAPARTQASYYRSSGGAEVDLVLELPGGHGVWAIEIKRSAAPRLGRGFHAACADLAPTRRCAVYAGTTAFALGEGVEAIGLVQLARELRQLA